MDLTTLPQRPAPQAAAGTPAPSGAEDEAKKAQDEQMRRDLLATLLDTAARERLSRIALVGPQRAAQIEGILLRMAQSGQLRGRVSEAQLIGLLEQVEGAQGAGGVGRGGIVFQRRKDYDEDEDW
jgi:programmed cell death protein 5